MSDQEKYATRIHGLLKKAESTDSQDEADSLFAKAQELMTKWAIDDTMLAQAAGKNQSVEEIERRKVILQYAFFKADASILQAIAVANQARVLITELRTDKRGERVAYIVGFPSDIERVEMMFASMMIQMHRAMEHHMKASGLRERRAKYIERRSFRYGFASRLQGRLQRSKNETAQTGTANPYAVALKSRDDQVERFLTDMGTRRSRGGAQRSSTSGHLAGMDAADRADVGNPRVRGSRSALPEG